MMRPMPAASPVTIDTARLTLRPHRIEDFAESAALWADPIVVRHIGGKPFTEEASWGRVLRYIGHWAALGFGYWVVREKDSGRFVGEVGFADFKRAIEPSFGGAPEMGWVLAPSTHGRGYATEAVRAALAWAEAHFGRAQRVVCMIDPDNEASRRVALRCGFAETARTVYNGEPVVLYERREG
jgi:RimJ/RimL family protein N-acetyltransferase